MPSGREKAWLFCRAFKIKHIASPPLAVDGKRKTASSPSLRRLGDIEFCKWAYITSSYSSRSSSSISDFRLSISAALT